MLGTGTGSYAGVQADNMYYAGTYVDAGTVQVGSPWALGGYSSTNGLLNAGLLDPADLTIDDSGVLDLNGTNVTITSLNSSFASSADIANGLVGLIINSAASMPA